MVCDATFFLGVGDSESVLMARGGQSVTLGNASDGDSVNESPSNPSKAIGWKMTPTPRAQSSETCTIFEDRSRTACASHH
jgi:hypothetical protein